jgi:DMSO/TMAO reductase YedYZ molybdopterin-dependent catalytic subunit
MTLSFDQVTNGSFIAYDPSDGSEKQIEDPLQALLAYEVDGKPLDDRSDGTLRLVIISPKNNQITDGHWSVKWIERIEVQPLGKEWTLSLGGVREEVIDRNTFQSCGATSCHQSTWTDEEGQVWAGVPLYLLAGRVDDEVTHDGPAYNRDLANTGYLIELIAADGYSTTVDSAASFYNRDILVANQVDGSPLPDKYFPLRLVGAGLEKGQRVGALAEIRLILEEAAATLPGDTASPEPTPQPAASTSGGQPPAGTTLWITGQTANSLALNDAALQALETVKIAAEHPKKGPGEYEGVRLNSLLNLAGVNAGASALVLTASDGYSTNVDLAAVQACADCLLAFTETEGVYNLVMPGFESSAWAKNVVKIEVQ